MKKRIVCLFLIVLLLSLTVVPPVSADNKFQYDLNDGVLTISGNGALIFINEDYDEFFELKTQATEIVIRDGITEIGSVFTQLNQLKKVTLPSTLKKLGIYTFRGCTSLNEVVFPDAEFEILGGTFQNCKNLKEVYIPNTAKISGYLPFDNTSLDFTIYTPENSDAYKYAQDNDINVIVSTREEFDNRNATIETDNNSNTETIENPNINDESPNIITDESSNIEIIYNSNSLYLEQPPVMYNDRILIPLRALCEQMGMLVSWTEDEQKITITNHQRTVEMTVGSKYATIDSQAVEMDVPAMLINDRTYIPIRFVSENFGAAVYWQEDAQRVFVDYPAHVENKIIIHGKDDIAKALDMGTIYYLKIDRANIDDFSFLKNLNVTLLQVLHNDSPFDMSCINAESIEQLYFHNVELINTDASDKFKKLNYFTIQSDNPVYNTNDFSFLSNCDQMAELSIYNYAVKNLDFVSNMKKLKSLTIINSALNDITGLQNCDNLSYLHIERAMINDITPLSNLTKLCFLRLRENYIEDISPLSGLSNLVVADLSDNFINDASCFENNDSLYNLNLSMNYLSKMPNLANLMYNGTLSLCNLSYNNISDIDEDWLAMFEEISKRNTDIQVDYITLNLFDNLFNSDMLRQLSTYSFITYTPTFVESASYFSHDISNEESIEFSNKISSFLENSKAFDEKSFVLEAERYIIQNCRIDFSLVQEHKDDAYGALFDVAVCTGFTDLMRCMLRHNGIKSKSVSGLVNNTGHSYLMCIVQEKPYLCDAMLSITDKDEVGYPNRVFCTDAEFNDLGYTQISLNIPPCNINFDIEERASIISQLGF